jgi:DNA-binding MarR family transcriptional regulator
MKTKNNTVTNTFSDDFVTIDGIMSFFSYKSVKELSDESGIPTKDVSKVVKEMLKKGYAIKRGRSYKYPNGR